MKNEILNHLASDGYQKSKWIENEKGRVYLRNSMNNAKHISHKMCVVASVESHEKGFFKDLITFLEENVKGAIVVECIHNKYLLDCLKRHGYKILQNGSSTHAMKIV